MVFYLRLKGCFCCYGVKEEWSPIRANANVTIFQHAYFLLLLNAVAISVSLHGQLYNYLTEQS
jgi:hypothetical protein